jgi:hypothetical protein
MQSWHGVKPSDSFGKITVGNWLNSWTVKKRRNFLISTLSSWLRRRKKSSGKSLSGHSELFLVLDSALPSGDREIRIAPM